MYVHVCTPKNIYVHVHTYQAVCRKYKSEFNQINIRHVHYMYVYTICKCTYIYIYVPIEEIRVQNCDSQQIAHSGVVGFISFQR